MNRGSKIAFVALLAAAVFTAYLAYAVLTWNGTVNINVAADTNFHVTDGSGTTLSSFSISVTATGVYDYTFRIYNDGNTPIAIAMTPTNNLPAGSSAAWNVTFPTSAIPIGGYLPVKLTITVNQAGTGSYAWQFTSAAA